MQESHEVQEFTCPVVVEKQDNAGTAYDVERCGASVHLHVEFTEPSWRAAVYVECDGGHGLDEMGRDAARDLDGVPLGA